MRSSCAQITPYKITKKGRKMTTKIQKTPKKTMH